MIKKGDLVITRYAKNRHARKFAGMVFMVASPSHALVGTWILSPQTIASNGFIIHWEESDLKKIDPPSTGELDRVPVRIKEKA